MNQAPNPVHLAALAWRQAALSLTLAERAAGDDDDLTEARRLAVAARTHERIAEFYTAAAMLGKDGAPERQQ